MSLFSKLFHKDEKKEKPNDPNVIELPFGSFTFSGDDPLEIGYEAEIDWYEKTSDLYYQPVSVFIEVDTPGTKDASIGLERFTRRYEDRERTDYKVKLAVTEHYLGDKDGVVVLFDENDKATVLEDSDYDRNFMSLIYPERNNEEA